MFILALSVRDITLSAEKRLMRQLLEKYKIAGKEGRPVINNTDITPIQFSLGLIQMDLNEKEKVLTTSMWTRMVSQDQKLNLLAIQILYCSCEW